MRPQQASMDAQECRAPKEALTKYEYARLVGRRVMQLAQNQPAHVPTWPGDARTAHELAEAEFAAGAMPLAIVQRLPTGEVRTLPSDDLRLVPCHALHVAAVDEPRPDGSAAASAAESAAASVAGSAEAGAEEGADGRALASK